MFSKIILVLSLVSLCLYLYGLLTILTNVEENLCKMTYMYEYPQYVKMTFKENKLFPKYKLYAYSEGHLIEEARMENFDGAPVLFIPGNSGSYKQIRSLASVALRKGLENGYMQHLDYFTVDLNEEFSGIYGGVLEDQTKFVELAIQKVLDLYKHLKYPPKTVVLIGHSMGGKIAQSLLISDKVSKMINTVITLGTPMDKPVVELDFYIHGFYDKIEKYWIKNRIANKISNKTNFCSNSSSNENNSKISNNEYKLNDKLIITIGGGSRDLMVHSGLPISKYSDVHAMTTSIPNVWVTTDHLCTVWCLQLVLVINRFLYSILAPMNLSHNNRYNVDGQAWINDKKELLQKSNSYFRKPSVVVKKNDVNVIDPNKSLGKWVENSKRIFTERFKNGLNDSYIQMIRLVDAPQYTILYGEVINVDTDDFIFGCAATEVTATMRYCLKGVSLTSQYVRKIPSLRHQRHVFKINLHDIKKKYPYWSHVLLRFLPTKEPLQINIDIHNPSDREIIVNTPKWWSFSTVNLIDETLIGSSHYNLIIKDLDESHQALELNVKTKSCSFNQYHSIGKLCVPWMDGFERYHYFTETKRKTMFVYVPQQKPSGYNSTINPIKLELNLDPSCRYTISVKSSLGMTMARTVQQYSHWLPAHLVAILLLALKYQISLTPLNENFKCGTLHSGLIKSSSIFIITASRVFVKMILFVKFLPLPDQYDLPLIVSILIHGCSLAILTFATGSLWAAISFFGNMAHKLLYKLIKLPIPTISGVLIPIIERFPIAVGILLLSISMGSCGAVGLILSCIIYFVLLSKMYEDYLEEFVFKTAKEIANKLFGVGNKKELNAELLKLEEENEDKNDGKNSNNEKNNFADIAEKSDAVADKGLNSEKIDEVENITEQNNDNTLTEREGMDDISDAELDKLYKETLEKQSKLKAERDKEIELQRAEYDGINIGLSKINFHLTLFFLLLILTLLNVPSAITWAKNYTYATILKPDPSIIPAIVTIASLSVIWQLSTPRNIKGYRVISPILYILGVICILYCQNSVYRLNGVVSTVFLIIMLHQVFGSAFVSLPKESHEFNEIKERVERIKSLMS